MEQGFFYSDYCGLLEHCKEEMQKQQKRGLLAVSKENGVFFQPPRTATQPKAAPQQPVQKPIQQQAVDLKPPRQEEKYTFLPQKTPAQTEKNVCSSQSEELKKLFPSLFHKQSVEDEKARNISSQWQQNYPLRSIYGFFDEKSKEKEFAFTIFSAIDQRIGRAGICINPEKHESAALLTLLQYKTLRGVLLSYEETRKGYFSSFLSHLPIDTTHKKPLFPLHFHGFVYETPIFSLPITRELPANKEAKGQLWQLLKSRFS